MPNWHVTFFYTDTLENVGWTENWWYSGTLSTSVTADAITYAQARMLLAMDTSFLNQIRVCNVDPPRDSLYLDLTGVTGLQGNYNHTTVPPAGLGDALLIRRDVATRNLFGHIFLRSTPAAIFNGRTYPSAALPTGWATNFAAFVALFTPTSNWLLRQLVAGVVTYPSVRVFIPIRRTTRRVGRPFDSLRGRRAIA